MRAPPVAVKHTSGDFSSSALSTARAKRSPTTEPIEPPMKAKSNAQATSGLPLSWPCIATSASRSPVAFCAALIRSEYFFWSLNFSTSVGPSLVPISRAAPPSNSALSRARARIGMWKLHFGQTSRFSSSSGRYRTAPQRSHFSHRPSGTLRLRRSPASVRMRAGMSFFSQDMTWVQTCRFEAGKCTSAGSGAA
jgi:hypothetical protein